MTNPFRLLTLYRKADALVDVLDDSVKAPALYHDAGYIARLLAALRGLWLELPLPQETKNMVFLRGALKNWKSTLAGLALIIGTAASVSQDPSKVFDKSTAAAIIAGVGLIAAKDGDKTGLPPQPAK